VVGDGVREAPVVAGLGTLNKSSNGHRLISPKATSDSVLPPVELKSLWKLANCDGPV
jgi:hypothetical protein